MAHHLYHGRLTRAIASTGEAALGYLIEGICPPPSHKASSDTDDSSMGSLIESTSEAHEIWVLRVKRRWIVRVNGEDFETRGDQADAAARAFSIAQLGDAPQEVVIFGRSGSIEERRSFHF